jgi:hypothetical protein
MAGDGQSGSQLEFVPTYKQMGFSLKTVFCQPLPDFLAEVEKKNLPGFGPDWDLTRRLFIKIDTEGAEVFIVPSLTRWVRCLPRKPVFYISTHHTVSKLPERDLAALVGFFRLFKYVKMVGNSRSSTDNSGLGNIHLSCGAAFTADMLKDGEDYIATDILPLRK